MIQLRTFSPMSIRVIGHGFGGRIAYAILRLAGPLRAQSRLILASVVLLGMVGTGRSLAADDGEIVHMAMSSRLELLSNLSASYDVVDTYGSPKVIVQEGPQKGSTTKSPGGVLRYSRKLMVLGGMSRYESTPLYDETISKEDQYETDAKVEIFNGGKLYRLRSSIDGQSPPKGEIQAEGKHARLPEPDLELALGLRGMDAKERITPDVARKMTVRPLGQGLFAVELRVNEHTRDEWTVDGSLGYAPRSYRRYFDDQAWRIVVAEDFQDIGGVYVPQSVTLTHMLLSASQPEKSAVGFVSKIKVRECKVGSPENTADQYVMAWPEKTRVADSIARVTLKVQDGKLGNDKRTPERPIAQIESQATQASTLNSEERRNSEQNTAATAPSPTGVAFNVLLVVAIACVALLLVLGTVLLRAAIKSKSQ